jgi:hypothetical protein
VDWREEKRCEELADRKANDAAKEDPVFTQCVVAYCNWRKDGNQGSFDLFKRDWYARRQAS